MYLITSHHEQIDNFQKWGELFATEMLALSQASMSAGDAALKKTNKERKLANQRRSIDRQLMLTNKK